MKYYWKFIGIGALISGFISFALYINVKEITISKLIFNAAFGVIDVYPQFIAIIMQTFIPLLLFQLFFGTYIYRHFCSSSVYFFTRVKRRKRWFIREVRNVFLFSAFYLLLLLSVGMLVYASTKEIIIDAIWFEIGIYYLLIYSLYLSAMTILINILSIKYSSTVAFVLVGGINVSGIAAFTFLGTTIAEHIDFWNKDIWLLKINPFANLVFCVHSSHNENINKIINIYGTKFDLNESVIYFLILEIVVIIVGCIIIEKYELLSNNKEVL